MAENFPGKRLKTSALGETFGIVCGREKMRNGYCGIRFFMKMSERKTIGIPLRNRMGI